MLIALPKVTGVAELLAMPILPVLAVPIVNNPVPKGPLVTTPVVAPAGELLRKRWPTGSVIRWLSVLPMFWEGAPWR